ncbi:hypothetical protein PF005_g551 [Phytophthora fragariae]|uniref:Uncharacterized protein n=1 Tax=Phytophthora fragariae TaxID=53985 RepID=A0A6A3ZKG6_9STRA|nr:hypothetical protein PF009_g605 [Phytophthora fragariae]KAE9030982.1 hypothetical protein PF011_g337 [Phytophthora fragariae]KAE9237659.1 hypothetical protein PF005_g551 [Phytophthora fragariae]KAE9255084.1 hypothetical protein PF004_g755 [Phytophthora fragariae]
MPPQPKSNNQTTKQNLRLTIGQNVTLQRCARNFDVWKTRVFAALDCKHLVGYVQKLDFDGISEEESDESASDVSDSDDEPKTKSSESFEVDSDAVDYDEERDVD